MPKQVQVPAPTAIPNTETDDTKKLTANQTAFLEALVKRKGNVTAAAEASDTSRSQVYKWREDPFFEAEYQLVRKKLEEFLFERAVELADEGDSTLLIFSLKALNRGRFDDRYVLQERAWERGLAGPLDVQAPVRVLLVKDEEPARIREEREKAEGNEQ